MKDTLHNNEEAKKTGDGIQETCNLTLEGDKGYSQTDGPEKGLGGNQCRLEQEHKASRNEVPGRRRESIGFPQLVCVN